MTIIAPIGFNTPHLVFNTTETGDLVASGGVLSALTDATISATSVFAGGEDIVGGFGVTNARALGTVLTGSGFVSGPINNPPGLAEEFVFLGGTTSGTTVNAHCREVVASGGLAIDTVVFGGTVLDFGVTQGAMLTGDTGNVANEFVNNGTALGTTVNHNAILDVVSSGFASGTTVNSGGFELADGGFASATIVNAGGVDLIFDLGTTSNTMVNGGLEVVEGLATGFIDGGRAKFTTVNGGDQIVFGFAFGTTVNSGFEVVWSGGFSQSATINTGSGFDFIVGSSFHQTLNGGAEFVVAHGIADETQINKGGIQVINSATAISGTIKAGGTQIVEAGGTAFNTSIDGGLMEVQSGGTTGAIPVTFTANGGDLQLDFSQAFSGLISGFASPVGVNEVLDLRDVTFTGATKVTFAEAPGNTSGTLTVTDGTHTANLTLLGQYSTANFSLASDGAGGTFVRDPALVGSAASPVLAAHA
jgi:autotransporter passenger strand-loop-strand repeat protein